MRGEGNESLVHDLRQARERQRGDFLLATASFQCTTLGCPVTLIRVGISEQMGVSKPFQLGNTCPRCRGPLDYMKLEVGK
jgi:hypothetical protein